jgi:methylated-DNA-[protein]-cysteine S-methyltransferase
MNSASGLKHHAVDSPFGPLIASWNERGLAGLRFASMRQSRGLPKLERERHGWGTVLAAQLRRYFRAGRGQFDIPLDLSSGTDFDRAVWRELTRIPPGEVRTYGQVARAVRNAGAARAVGNACGRNPLPVVVPCHRVVASGGLGGFGLGLRLKRQLLALEGVHV